MCVCAQLHSCACVWGVGVEVGRKTGMPLVLVVLPLSDAYLFL
jgi:hypothetical protein